MMHPPPCALYPHSYLNTSTNYPHNIVSQEEPSDNMKEEVTAAVDFFARLVETPILAPSIKKFKKALTRLLAERYQNHWHMETPSRGQAYRCIEICDRNTDKTLSLAAQECGVLYSQLRLPPELYVWVDPLEVTCRFGEELGCFLPIFIKSESKTTSYIENFDFKRLCERPLGQRKPFQTIRTNGQQNEQSPANRVISSSVELMEVDIERDATSSAPLLTPPSTPPPTSSSSANSSPSHNHCSSSPSFSPSSPPSSSSSSNSQPPKSYLRSSGKSHQPPSYLNFNSSSQYQMTSTRSSPGSPSVMMFPSSPNGNSVPPNRNSFNNYNLYNNFANANLLSSTGQASFGRSPPKMNGHHMNISGNTHSNISAMNNVGKLSKWGPYNFPSSNPNGYPPQFSPYFPSSHRFNANNNNNERGIWLGHQRPLRA